MRRRSIQSLADAVRDVEGVIVNGGANETDIQIRGMPGDYTLLMVDGRRQGGRESRVNGNRGYEQSYTPPAAAIERIEVVRGPMSSLYGSDAIGGVINIITRRPSPTWSGTLSYDYSLRESGEQGNAHNAQAYVSGPVVGNVLGVQAWGSYLARQADDDFVVTNGFARSRNRTLTGRLVLTPLEGQEIIAEGGISRLRNGEGVSPNWATRQQDNDRDHWSVMHNGTWGRASSFLSYLDENTSREGLATPAQADVFGRRPEVRNQVFDAKVTVPVLGNPTTAGVQWLRTGLRDRNQANVGTPREREYENYSVVQRAVFAESSWTILPRLTLTGGLRLDDHEEYGNHVNPRAYAAPFDTVYVSLYKYLGPPFGAVLAGPADVIARACEYRHLYGGLIAQGWVPATLALDGLNGFQTDMARAHAAADALIGMLERTGRVRRIANGLPSNIHALAMPKDMADLARERGRMRGIELARWQDGQWRLTVNRSILRRPVADYAALFG